MNNFQHCSRVRQRQESGDRQFSGQNVLDPERERQTGMFRIEWGECTDRL